MAKIRRERELARVRGGSAIIAALVLLMMGVFFLDTAVRARTEGPRVTVLATSAPGLRAGSTVLVAGRPVGRVISVGLGNTNSPVERVLIEAALERSATLILRANAHAEVAASDLLGPLLVVIDPGDSADPWDYRDTLRSAGQPLDQERVRALADTLLLAMRGLREGVAEARTTLENAPGSLQRFNDDPAQLQGFRANLALLERILIDDLPASSIGRLATDTLIEAAAARIRGRAADLKGDPGRDGAIRGLERATEAFDGLTSRIDLLVQGLEAGEGTAGRVLMDGELSRQIELLRTGLRTLTEEMMRSPERWLRVRVF